MTSGYSGKMLDIDLSAKRVTRKDVEAEILKSFLGGIGLGTKILYGEVRVDVDPLSPNNIVIFAPGTLSGTWAPSNSRTEVVTKSPLTEIVGRGNFGGWWGSRLKRAGFEAIVVRGK